MDLGICLVIIVGIILTILRFIFNKSELKNIIIIGGMLICLIINSFIVVIDYHGQTDCQEVWSGQITSVKHNEEWDEYHPAWDEEVTKTDSKGKTHTKIIHHPAWTEHHDAENYIYTSDNGCNSVYETKEGKHFTDNFVNSNEELEEYYPIGMPTASIHTYENKVQASYSIFKHENINLNDYNLPDYPKEINYFNVNSRLIGDFNNSNIIEEKLNKINTELNDTNNPNNVEGKKSYKQVNLIVVNLGDVSEDYGQALQDYWKNGNKNDFVVVLGSNNNKITWCYCFSWCEQELLKEEIRDYIIDKDNNLDNFENTLDFISNDIEEKYSRKEFSDFSYLHIDTSTGAKTIMIILNILVVIFAVGFMYNSHNENK